PAVPIAPEPNTVIRATEPGRISDGLRAKRAAAPAAARGALRGWGRDAAPGAPARDRRGRRLVLRDLHPGGPRDRLGDGVLPERVLRGGRPAAGAGVQAAGASAARAGAGGHRDALRGDSGRTLRPMD